MGIVYLIRHGFTPANNANYNNQRNLWTIANDREMPLEKEYGVMQAKELGEFLKDFSGKTLVLVSPYKRAKDTLKIALKEVDFKYDMEVCEELRENNSGFHYAKTKEEILEQYSEAIEYYHNYELDPFKTPYMGGESSFDVKERTRDIAKRINTLKEDYDNILIFAHGTINYWIYYWLNKKEMSKMRNCEVIVGSGDSSGESIFLPNTWVPKGYMIDIDSYLLD